MMVRPTGTTAKGSWAILIGVGIASVVLMAAGAMQIEAPAAPALLTAGIVGLIGVALAVALLKAIAGRTVSSGPASVASPTDHRLERALEEVRDLLILSENTRHLLYADRESEVLRHYVDSFLSTRDVGAAEQLCANLEERGMSDLASVVRQRIVEAKEYEEAQHAQTALDAFEAALAQRNWALAFQEASRIREMIPGTETARHLDERVRQARDEHKRTLERQFLDAANRENVDDAMGLLRELDRYMTRDEAERLSRDAHAIIQKHRERLSAIFQTAIHEKRWSDAAKAGNTIIEQYPNTKMADEVRSMIDLIRTRATQAAVAAED